MRIRHLLVAAVWLLVAAPLPAQSLFNSAGLGLPVEALDGRARALGNLGIGLQGSSLIPSDPAAAATLLSPTAVIAGQPSWVDFTRSGSGSGETGSFQGNRFPLLGVSYPALSGMMTLYAGSFLDQRFEGERSVSVELVDGPADATDLFKQEGSISTVRLGYARMIGENASMGVSVGRYAGSVIRRMVRRFGALDVPGDVTDYESGGRWSYAGNSITGGLSVELGSFGRVASSVTWSSRLQANASKDTGGADRTFDLPLQFRIGVSAILVPGFLLSASMARADWADIADDLADGATVGGTSGFGVGIELTRARLLGKEAPLRFGYRKSDLPFSVGGGSASERVFAGGFGLALNETNGFLLAGADFSLERGRRTGGTLTENFWRATVSLRVSGY